MTFHQIDLGRTQEWSLSCAAARTVSVGASVSPAALDGRTGVSNRCVWGCGDRGTFEHCAWGCGERPERHIARPGHPLGSRFGWAFKRDSDEYIKGVQAWLVRVQQAIWHVTRDSSDA